MTHRLILTSPNAQLRQMSEKVDLKDIPSDEFKELIKDLLETMRAENGIGIAAPQIGVPQQLIIVDGGVKQPEVFFNPMIVAKSFRKIESEEGCLSVPGVFGIVKRHCSVKIKAWNHKGELVEFRVRGLAAVVFQHEIDHLNGILFIDKVIRYTTHPAL